MTNSKASAVASFRKLLGLDSHHQEAAVLLGADLIQLNRVDEAIGMLRRFLETHPNSSAGAYWLAVALTENEQYLSSMPLFDKLASKNKLPAEGWLSRGRALLALDRLEASLASVRRAIQLNPALEAAHDFLGQIIMRPEASGRFHLSVVGGVGDILQCVPFLLDIRTTAVKVIVMSHFKGAASLFDDLAIPVDRFVHDSDSRESRHRRAQLTATRETVPCPRRWHFSVSPFSGSRISFSDARPALAVHLCGSSLSINAHRRKRVATKTLPVAVLHGLMASNQFNIILFGTKEEIESFGLTETERLRFACFERIADSLAVVAQCAAFVGSDSAIKTMAAMLGIPAVVWLTDIQDPFRDSVFITPYVDQGLMKAFRYKSASKDIDSGIQFTQAALAQFGLC